MPIPGRFWAELSIDFITEHPPTDTEQATNSMVITDRMAKGVNIQNMNDVSAEVVAARLLSKYGRIISHRAAAQAFYCI